jgi:hypothetical protein
MFHVISFKCNAIAYVLQLEGGGVTGMIERGWIVLKLLLN